MIPKSFYLQEDVCKIATQLLGMELVSQINGKYCSGYIVETEAYAGKIDRASHAFGGKYTPRTKTMYLEGGCSYIYLCYGIHSLFNVVTNIEGIPHAVLIRAIQPLEGVETMEQRRKFPKNNLSLCNGPGSLSQAFGFSLLHNGISLQSDIIHLNAGKQLKKSEIIASPRVGVAYAKEDALLPYRYRIKDNPYCSPAK